jgi:hypothetical protein
VSDVKPSVDPVSVLLAPGERSPVDKSADSVAAGLVGLAYLAREAAEEKRHKQCLEATKAILKIDPEHKEARKLQSAVRTELDQQFVNAQTLARDAQLKDDRMLYERAAAALRRIIEVDPDNLEARTLLQDTVAASYFHPAPATARPFWKSPRKSIVVGSLAAVAIAGVIALGRETGLTFSDLLPARVGVFASSEPSGDAAAAGDTAAAPGVADTAVQASLPASSVLIKPAWTETTPLPVRVEDSDRMLRVAAPAAPAAPPPRPATAPVANAAAAPMGALAVSAAVPAEIYRGEESLGSTPATLQLPEGPQTLEYRYQGLRQTLTHFIARDQTTRATVSFLTKVQINAQPWAQVFMDGINLTLIGQTPLGDVNVPIGSVLVFQNPGFPDKRHRVTARDTAIQVTFP